MGKMLSALLHLQTIERQLVEVRSRLGMRKNAVAAQQRRIDQFRGDWDQLNQQRMDRRKEADRLELDLRQKEEKVADLRGVLNTAKTNKEYAAVLTQINTLKADKAKLEDQILKVIAGTDDIQSDADEVKVKIGEQQRRLEDVAASAEGEITRLTAMLEELTAKRREAAGHILAEELALFERISDKLSGSAMARIEIQGDKPPHSYVCGGCFMSLNAEHANALRSRDEIRTCDSCGRILYLELKQETQQKS